MVSEVAFWGTIIIANVAFMFGQTTVGFVWLAFAVIIFAMGLITDFSGGAK